MCDRVSADGFRTRAVRVIRWRVLGFGRPKENREGEKEEQQEQLKQEQLHLKAAHYQRSHTTTLFFTSIARAITLRHLKH